MEKGRKTVEGKRLLEIIKRRRQHDDIQKREDEEIGDQMGPLAQVKKVSLEA